MESIIAKRMSGVPKSFIREILKISLNEEIISFAGGLPNKELFPTAELRKATDAVFEKFGNNCLQYANSEGDIGLRQLIAQRYRENKGIQVNADNILILNGSQQGMDILAKVLLNEGDCVAVEEPGYLGALQAFALYQPAFESFGVGESGVDINAFKDVVSKNSPKIIYTVPNFQNPSGITYSNDDREKITSILSGQSTYLIEDDPYGELRFSGEARKSFHTLMPEQTIMLGSFSKTVVPGFRIGWIVAPDSLYEKLLVAKQAADLHTCHFTQYIFHQYMLDNDVDMHIQHVCNEYGKQCNAMIRAVKEYLPESITFTNPEGGMFLWGSLPEGMNAMELCEFAVEEKVVFVPGSPFYIGTKNHRTFRLSYSCVDEQTIITGVKRLNRAFEKYALSKK